MPRAIAVQPQWFLRDFATPAAFRAWLARQLALCEPHLRPGANNLVVLTEYNGLPLALLNNSWAARAPTFTAAMARLSLRPGVAAAALRYRTPPPRALMLAQARRNVGLYLSVLSDLARRYRVTLVSGSIPSPHWKLARGRLRPAGRAVYNTTFVFGPGGELLGSADKVHLTPLEGPAALDLSPGSLDDLRAIPTPAGSLGVAISLDAFRDDVLERLSSQGVTVLTQPDANPGPWTDPEGLPPDPDNVRDQPIAWLESAWRAASFGSIRYVVNPMAVGNLFDVSFDGQSAITARAEEAPEPRAYALTTPRPGFLVLAPWPPEHPGASRAELLAAGAALAAGSGHATENRYLETVLWADLEVEEGLPLAPLRPHEAALQAFLEGRARF